MFGNKLHIYSNLYINIIVEYSIIWLFVHARVVILQQYQPIIILLI